MNTDVSLEPYDFHKPCSLADGVEQRLTNWQRALCPLAVDGWRRHVPGELEVTFVAQESVSMREAVKQLPFPATAYRILISGIDTPTLFVLPRPLALAIVTSMLGDTNEALPEDRELTDIESSLCELLFQELAEAISTAWPERDPIPCFLDGPELRPDRCRLLPLGEQVVLCRFRIAGAFGAADGTWLLPQLETEEFLSEKSDREQKSSDRTRVLLEQRARDVPVSLTVRLGNAHVSVSELAKLRAGDVILLDQRITDPLVAEVSGQPVFRGWPGRSGSRQAFQIEALL